MTQGAIFISLLVIDAIAVPSLVTLALSHPLLSIAGAGAVALLHPILLWSLGSSSPSGDR